MTCSLSDFIMTKLFCATFLAALLVTSASVAQTSENAAASSAVLANPAVRSAMELPRNEPADYLRATLSLLDLGAPELAREVFSELTALELDDTARAKLVKQLGAASLLRLSRRDALGDDAADFVNKTLAAATAEAASPERLAELLGLLDGQSEAKRRMAVSELAALGTPAVVPLIRMLGTDNTQEPALQGARAALVRLGPIAHGALLATLRSGDARLEAEAAQILASLRSPQAAPLMAARALTASSGSSLERSYTLLTGQSASIESTTGLLKRTLENLNEGVPAFRPNDVGSVEYWVWSMKPVDDQQPRPLTLSAADADLFYQSELANDLAALESGNPKLQSLALRLAIERSAIENAAEASPIARVKELSSTALNRLLDDSLKGKSRNCREHDTGSDRRATRSRNAGHFRRQNPRQQPWLLSIRIPPFGWLHSKRLVPSTPPRRFPVPVMFAPRLCDWLRPRANARYSRHRPTYRKPRPGPADFLSKATRGNWLPPEPTPWLSPNSERT